MGQSLGSLTRSDMMKFSAVFGAGVAVGVAATTIYQSLPATSAKEKKGYKSTRGGMSGVTFEEAILSGYAPDGGLYVPETMPCIRDDLNQWLNLSYRELAVEVMCKFTREEIPKTDMRSIMNDAFDTFTHSQVVPLVKVKDVHVAELFHGSTLAFKDFGQQILCRLINYFATKRDRKVTILVSTTGDTGPAALSACSGAKNIAIYCSFPKGQVSKLQQLQMTTVDEPNVCVYSFEGGGDDMDLPIKTLLNDPAFKEQYNPIGINSFNIGRVTAQTIHFIWSYLQLVRSSEIKLGDEVTFTVPCGALGNVTAGYMSKSMGLPIHHFNCGVNVNNILDRAIKKGEFLKEEMKRTLSEAINIQVPYNFERLLYFMTNEDSGRIKKWMSKVDNTGGNIVPSDILNKLRQILQTHTVTDEEMVKEIQNTWETERYLLDPHTAIALVAAETLDDKKRPSIVLSTAHPCKFEEAIRYSLGDSFWDNQMKSLMPMSARELGEASEVSTFTFRKGENWLSMLRDLVEARAR